MTIRSIMAAALLVLALFSACSKSEKQKENFHRAYKEIHVAMEMIADSAKFAEEKKEILEKYEFEPDEYARVYADFANENPEEFFKLLDSVREDIKNDIRRLEIEREEKDKKAIEEKNKKKKSPDGESKNQ